MKKSLKYIIIFVICLFLSTIVYAEDTLVLEEPVIQFNKIKYYGLQGYSVVRDKLFMVLEGHDDTKSIIKVYDLNTYQEVLSYEYGSLGHANDVTYNSKNNKIYVIASSGSDVVYTFNGDTFKYEDSFKIGLPIRSITYIDKYDRYAVRTVANGFMYDNEFKLKSKFPFIVGMNFNSEVGRQGWTYYNDIIYYASWSWVRLGGDGSNVIFTYDLNGHKLSNLYTGTDIGEIEGVDFYNNKMVLGFNGYDSTIKFYLTDIPDIEKDEEKIVVEEVKIVEKKNYKKYIILGISATLLVGLTIIIIFKNKKK